MGSDNFSVTLWGVKDWNERKGGSKSGAGLTVDYPNDLFEANITYNFFGDSINPGLGFLPRRACHYLYTGFSYMPRLEKGWIGSVVRQWFIEFRVSNYWNLNGQLESRRNYTATVNLRTESGDQLEFNVIPKREVLPEDLEVFNDTENVFFVLWKIGGFQTCDNLGPILLFTPFFSRTRIRSLFCNLLKMHLSPLNHLPDYRHQTHTKFRQ
jgi:hypothetical protein